VREGQGGEWRVAQWSSAVEYNQVSMVQSIVEFLRFVDGCTWQVFVNGVQQPVVAGGIPSSGELYFVAELLADGQALRIIEVCVCVRARAHISVQTRTRTHTQTHTRANTHTWCVCV